MLSVIYVEYHKQALNAKSCYSECRGALALSLFEVCGCIRVFVNGNSIIELDIDNRG
jgi:hypothetical protein